MDQLSPEYKDVSTVISIVPLDIREKKPGLIPGEFFIPAVKDPLKDVNVLVVTRATFPVYIDENRPALIVPELSDRICASICRDWKTTISEYEVGVSEPGLFWDRGALTVQQVESTLSEKLDIARKLQAHWFQRLVASADDDWEKYHQRRMISGLQRTACKVLMFKRDWNIEDEALKNLALVKCRFCMADIDPMAMVCRYCQGVQDQKRYESQFVGAGKVVR